jgi:hypothetical protein
MEWPISFLNYIHANCNLVQRPFVMYGLFAEILTAKKIKPKRDLISAF